MKCRIVITEKGGAARAELFSKSAITIGRSADNDLVLTSTKVSKEHAQIDWQAGRFVLVDRGSTNGRFVNGTRTNAPRILEATDKVRIGTFTLTVAPVEDDTVVVATTTVEDALHEPVGSARPASFERLKRLGTSRVTETFLARKTDAAGTAEIVVVKRLLPEFAADAEFTSMFLGEARLAAQLHHPNAARLHDIGIYDGSHCISMEYVSGRSVEQIIHQQKVDGGHLPVEHVCRIVADACRALSAAHGLCGRDGASLGFLHRDVSARHILVSFDGVVKVIDFGVARAFTELGRTRSSVLQGYPGSMSPEQIRGAGPDHRSDVFALGLVMYELLTLKHAFTNELKLQTLMEIARKRPPNPRAVNPDIPLEVIQILSKSLEKTPEKRFGSVQDFQLALEEWLEQSPKESSDRQLSRLLHDLFDDELTSSSGRMAVAGVGTIIAPSWRGAEPHAAVQIGFDELADTLLGPPAFTSAIPRRAPLPHDERRTVGRYTFVRLKSGGVVFVDKEGTRRELRDPVAEEDLDALLRHLDGSSAVIPDDHLEWLFGGVPGWELLDEAVSDVRTWLVPDGAGRSVLHMGGGTPMTRFGLARRQIHALKETGELRQIEIGPRGSATWTTVHGEVAAPRVFLSLVERFGEEAAGRAWRFRPERLSFPEPSRSMPNVMFFTSGGNFPVNVARKDVGPFTWLAYSQQSGGASFRHADVAIVDGLPATMRTWETREWQGATTVEGNVAARDVLRRSLSLLLRSTRSFALRDVLALVPHLHFGDVLTTEDQVKALTGTDRSRRNASDEAVSLKALEAWRPPSQRAGTIEFVTHLGTEKEFADAELHGVFVVQIRDREVEVTRVCNGRMPARRVCEGRAYCANDGGRVLAAAVVDAAGDDVDDTPLHPAALAWWHAARQEHASVASFSRAALELMALGAPLPLVSRMHEAAIDEVRHAAQSLAIAHRFDARVPTTFAPLPALAPRDLDRATLAAVTLDEAACPETFAAAVARAAADACDDDDIRAVLRAIADDEARHAALAWDIVAWCGGAVVDPHWFAPPAAPTSSSVDDRCGQLTSRSLERAMQSATPELRARAAAVAPRALREPGHAE